MTTMALCTFTVAVITCLPLLLFCTERDETLSEFGQHFFQSIDRLRADSQHKRDDLISELDDATTRQQEALEHVMEVLCSDTRTESQGHSNKTKSSVSSGKSVIEITMRKTLREKNRRDGVERGVTSDKGDNELVHDGNVSDEGSDINEDATDTPRARKKWADPTGQYPTTDRPHSGTSSGPLLTSRAKRRSIPQKGVPQSKLVLARPKPADGAAVEGKIKQSVVDLDTALSEDELGRSQSRSGSVNRSPNEYQGSEWK